MPSFDVVSEVDWQEIDNAKNQAQKEASQRFDFKNVKCEIDVNEKDKNLTIKVDAPEKMEAFTDIFKTKLSKRGFSLLSFEFSPTETSGGGGAKRDIKVQAGIDKEKAKSIVKAIKDNKFKAQAQVQEEQVRVTSKKRDELQDVIAFLKEKQSDFKIPLQFDNFRD